MQLSGLEKARRRIEKQQATKKRRRQPEIFSFEETDDDFANEQREEIQNRIVNDEVAANGEIIVNNEADVDEPVVEFEVGTTTRGAKCLWHGGYMYIRNHGSSTNAWRCSQYWKRCPATVIVKMQDNATFVMGRINPGKQHTHMPNESALEARKKFKTIGDSVQQNPRIKPTDLMAELRENIELEVRQDMGKDEALRKRIQRVKRKRTGNVDSGSVLDMHIPELLQHNGMPMLIYDSRETRPGERDVVLVFAAQELLDLMKKHRNWHMDATFKASPKDWAQCLVLGPSIKRRMVTVVHALMPGKARKYEPNQIGIHSPQQSTPTLNVSSVSTEHDYDGYYSANNSVNTIVIQDSVNSVNTNVTQDIAGIQQRWEEDIVKPPRFAIAVWNVNDRVTEELDRTNNSLEASHFHFARGLNYHPTRSDFFQHLRDVVKQLDISASLRLNLARERDQKAVLKDETILELLEEATYDDDQEIWELLYELGLQVRGYAQNVFVPNQQPGAHEDDEGNENQGDGLSDED